LRPREQRRRRPEDGPPKHFLWKVTGSKGVVYLLCTIDVDKAAF
jgi:hypothetical protein